MHPDGYIELKDRSKDIIISGGENISTIEVEDVLYRHPWVLEAAVVARPDPMWGETPCAFVTLKHEAAATADEIIVFCRDHLARFKVPRGRRQRLRPARSRSSCSGSERRERFEVPQKKGGRSRPHRPHAPATLGRFSR